jgi:ankyrin repeat protein
MNANQHGFPILHFAAIYGKFGIVKCLVHSGANIHAVDYLGDTAKTTAAKYGYPRIQRYLSHAEITDIIIALLPLELSPYVLLWILQWATQFQDSDQLRVLRLIEGIQRSRAPFPHK